MKKILIVMVMVALALTSLPVLSFSAQHDMVIDNATASAVRADINSSLAALVSNSSGATEPATKYAYQFWADTTTGLMKQRNSANTSWATIYTIGAQLAPLASPTFTGTVALPSTTSVGAVSSTELGYLDGVTSAIQTQLTTKAPLVNPAFTTPALGVATADTLTVANYSTFNAGLRAVGVNGVVSDYFYTQNYGSLASPVIRMNSNSGIFFNTVGGSVSIGYENNLKADFGTSIVFTGATVVSGNLRVSDGLVLTKSAPASNVEICTQGETRVDANYIYICATTNSWKRAALSSW